jgi:hypothetical protein
MPSDQKGGIRTFIITSTKPSTILTKIWFVKTIELGRRGGQPDKLTEEVIKKLLG